MDTLRKIINENEQSFNKERLPFGNNIRFFRKLNKPVSRWIWYPAFASLAIIIGLSFFIPSGEEQAINVYRDYCRSAGLMAGEIQAMAPEEEQYFLDIILERITFEAVPLFDELPEEISDRQKAKLMKEYYKRKLDGIAKLKALVADAAEIE